ncbi:MAG: type III secretion protein [Sulfobacillus thermosulfidooxidans]|nr:MAG: type III secretion protein [Sulfobacillus thermosulfidooxidans]
MTVSLVSTQLTETFFLVASRLAGLVFSAPVLSSAYLPRMLKVALILALAGALSPSVQVSASISGLAWGLDLIVNFAVGMLIGLILSLFLAVLDMAGQVVTYELGLGLAIASNPGLDENGSFLSEWQSLLALFVFVATGGLELSVIALHASFQAIGLNIMALPLPALSFVTGLMTSALTMTLLVAFPLLLAGFIVNMAVGIMSRAFPQMNAYYLSLPVNFGVSLLVFAAMLPLLMGILPSFWDQAFTDVSRLLALLEGKP